MSFMEPEVFEDDYFVIETNDGTEIVPCSTVGTYTRAPARLFHLYVEGLMHPDVAYYYPQHGWLARLSAPGYLDCTAWSAHETQQEAEEYLEEMYGNDSD